MEARHGIKAICLAKKGTLLTTPVDLVVGGIRPETELLVDPYDAGTGAFEEFLANKSSFKVTCGTYQARFRELNCLINNSVNKCDAQVVAMPQTIGQAASGGVFNFVEGFYPGLMWKYTMSNKIRKAEFTLEFAAEDTFAQSIYQNALTNTPVDLSAYGYGGAAYNLAAYIPPAYLSALVDTSTYMFAKDELLEYELTLETVDDGKTAMNRSRVHFILCTFRIKGTDATITNLLALNAKSRDCNLVFSEKYNDTYNDVVTFAAGSVIRKENVKIADKDRNLEITFKKKIPLGNFTFSNLDGDSIAHALAIAA